MTALSRFLHHLYFLCQKELLTLFKDPRMRIQLIMPVIIEGFLFGYAANYNIEEVPYAVVDTAHLPRAISSRTSRSRRRSRVLPSAAMPQRSAR